MPVLSLHSRCFCGSEKAYGECHYLKAFNHPMELVADYHDISNLEICSRFACLIIAPHDLQIIESESSCHALNLQHADAFCAAQALCNRIFTR